MKMKFNFGRYFSLAVLGFSSLSALCQLAMSPTVPIRKVDTSTYAILPYDSAAMIIRIFLSLQM